MNLIPEINQKNLTFLDLGAGIGRFTGELAEKVGPSGKVYAVDFIESFCEKNRKSQEELGYSDRVEVQCKSALDIDFPENSVDVVFSNWLMMYFNDDEAKSLINKILKMLKPNGLFFFRESCFHQSGSRAKDDVNPTHYRNPNDYTILGMTEKIQQNEQVYGLDIIELKSSKTYAEIKNNKNQYCWLMRKNVRDEKIQQNEQVYGLDIIELKS